MLILLSSTTMAESAKEYIVNIGVEADLYGLERVKQTLVAPPFLPKHRQQYSGKPRIIEIEMIIEEKEIEIEPGVFVQAMTFNGTNPGPMIVVHEGDYVELTLKNPDTNFLLHNIDFHSSTGALGGGALTKVAPGEQVTLRFKADKPGTTVGTLLNEPPGQTKSPLCSRWSYDSLSCGLRHVWRYYDLTTRWAYR